VPVRWIAPRTEPPLSGWDRHVRDELWVVDIKQHLFGSSHEVDLRDLDSAAAKLEAALARIPLMGEREAAAASPWRDNTTPFSGGEDVDDSVGPNGDDGDDSVGPNGSGLTHVAIHSHSCQPATAFFSFLYSKKN
jgi:hypothetical protein